MNTQRRQLRRAQAPAWQRDFFASRPIFADLWAQFAKLFDSVFDDAWPDCSQFNRWAQTLQCHFDDARPLQFCTQNQACSALEYETGILHQRQIPCRPGDWHDLFNALMWLSFPRSKSALNRLHVARGSSHDPSHANRRCPLRNFATLVDEAGLIIAYTEPATVDSHRQHHWEELFVQQRAQWWQCRRPFIIGHGVYEQCLSPYLGLTAKTWYWPVSAAFFHWPLAQQYQYLDRALADALLQTLHSTDAVLPTTLLPMPLLGIPGWWPENQQAEFYHNSDYFRPHPSRRALTHS